MVNCKFFLEGYCKFGTRCRFDHVDPYNASYVASEGRPFGSSILKADSSNTPLGTRQEFSSQNYSHLISHSFQSHDHPPKTSKYNVQEIMEIVNRDVLQSERGSQWQLTCYSPLKDLPNLPGLEDHSPEELRYECYKAAQTGSVPLWQAIVQQLYSNVMKINNELKRKDTGYTIIDRWLRSAEEKSTQSNVTQPFGGSHVGSPAFGAESAGSVFGGGNASSPFFTPSSEQPAVFGGGEPASGFGSGNITSSFGSGNSFASPSFGSSPTIPAVNPFFSQVTNQSGSDSFSFSLSQTQPTNTPISPGSAFPFGSNSSVTQSSPFTQNAQPVFQPLTSVVDDIEFSKDDELTVEDIAAFKADKFSFGSIPTKPPPRGLCNL